MGPKNVACGQSFNTMSSLLKIQILVVDDDPTSLTVVSAMLKMSSCQERMLELTVVTVKSPLDALATLRMHRGVFDLVLTDLHMPGMSGMTLKKHVDAEFKLPVIIMSSDDKESVIMESLKMGALSYIVKPVNPDDLRSIWQQAIAAKREKSVVVLKEIGGTDVEMSSPVEYSTLDADKNTSVSENIGKSGATDSRKGKKRSRGDEEDANTSAQKRAKVVWTNSLHNRFLQAVSHIGLDKAVPKKILEFMNVPGLTRENVASHLQKYRLFLKKVAEKGIGSSKTLSERALRSAFRSSRQSAPLRNNRQEYSQFPGLEQMKASLLGIGVNIPSLGNSSFSPRRLLPSQEVKPGPLFDSLPSFQQPIFGSTTSPYFLTNRNGNAGTNSLLNGGVPFGLANATTGPVQMCQQQQIPAATPDFGEALFNFGASGNQSPGNVSGIGIMGSISNNSGPSLNCTDKWYGGARMSSDGRQLVGTGQMLSGYSNGGACNTNVLTFGNGNSNYLSFGGSSFSSSSSSSAAAAAAGGFDCGNKFSPAFTNNFSHESNNSVLSTLSQQSLGKGGENNDSVLNLMSAAASAFSSNNPDDHLQNILEADLDKFLLDTFNVPAQFQQQGGDGILNLDFHCFEADTNLNNILKSDVSSPYHVEESPSRNEQCLNQHLGGGGGEGLGDFGLKEMPSLDNMPTGDQIWGEDFLDSLLVENEAW